MKKQLLFTMAIAASVFTVNAQTYAVQETDKIAKDTEITSVEGVKLTFGDDTYKIQANADINGGAVYTAYASGSANPTDAAGISFDKAGATTPTAGSLFNLEMSKDGTMEIAVVLNAAKKFYVLEDGVALSDYDAKTEAAKYYGTYTFPVRAGKTYTTFCTGSKLGFYGFTFTPGGGSGIASTATDKEVLSTEYYNVVGVKQNELAKGLNIIKKTMNDGSVEVEKAFIK